MIIDIKCICLKIEFFIWKLSACLMLATAMPPTTPPRPTQPFNAPPGPAMVQIQQTTPTPLGPPPPPLAPTPPEVQPGYSPVTPTRPEVAFALVPGKKRPGEPLFPGSKKLRSARCLHF
jgi:hypothetical protein